MVNEYNLKINNISAVVSVLKLNKKLEIIQTINSKIKKRFWKLTKINRKYDESKDFMKIPVEDIETEDISRYFLQVVKFIDMCTQSGRNVVVFCNNGLSRSPSMVLAYFIWRYDMEFEDAKHLLLKQRKKLNINRSFENQLVEWRIFNTFNFGLTSRKEQDFREIYMK